MTMDNRSTQNKTSNRTSSSKTSNKTTSKTTGKVSGRATSSNSRNASLTICTHKSAACFPKQALGIHAALFVYSVWAAASIASHTLEKSS